MGSARDLVLKRQKYSVSEMTQWVSALTAKTDDLSSSPRTCKESFGVPLDRNLTLGQDRKVSPGKNLTLGYNREVGSGRNFNLRVEQKK